MDETAPITPGRVLNVWRLFAGLSAADLAEALGVQPSAVSMWENDKRAIRANPTDNPTPTEDPTTSDDNNPIAAENARRPVTIGRVAAALGLDADHATAMKGMWLATNSPNVLPARPKWFHNFQEPAGPVWVWLRGNPAHGDQHVLLEFGPFDRRLPLAATPGGLLVHSPTSVPNPPLTGTFDGSGWMDAARGVIPPEVNEALGMITVAAAALIGRHPPRDQPLEDAEEGRLGGALGVVGKAASRWFGLTWDILKPHFGVLRPNPATHALNGHQVESTIRPLDATTDQHGALVSQPMMSPQQMEAIRSARGLTREAAAEAASNLDQKHPITSRMIEHLEKDGRIPAVPQALARLDMVYQTDGRLGIDRVYDTLTVPRPAAGRYTVTFPKFWIGHVWLQSRGPQSNATGTIDLVWMPWHRTQRLQSGTVITTRKATDAVDACDLHVTVPTGWNFTAGLGAVPTALDINVGWRPVSFSAAVRLLMTSLSAIGKSTPPRTPQPRTDKPGSDERPARFRRRRTSS